MKTKSKLLQELLLSVEIELYLKRKFRIDNTIVKATIKGKEMIYTKGKWTYLSNVLVEQLQLMIDSKIKLYRKVGFFFDLKSDHVLFRMNLNNK